MICHIDWLLVLSSALKPPVLTFPLMCVVEFAFITDQHWETRVKGCPGQPLGLGGLMGLEELQVTDAVDQSTRCSMQQAREQSCSCTSLPLPASPAQWCGQQCVGQHTWSVVS